MKIPLFQGIFTLYDPSFLWHIFGAYFLPIWGVGVVKIVLITDPQFWKSCNLRFAILPAKGGLSGAIRHDIARLSLRCPISRNTFSGRLAAPQNVAITPALVLSSTQALLCDIPCYNIWRDNCAIPHKTRTNKFCDTVATSIARYGKYCCWASTLKTFSALIHYHPSQNHCTHEISIFKLFRDSSYSFQGSVE